MANRYRTATGLWSDVTKWDGGTTLPGALDDCFANNFICTVDGNYTVASVNTSASTPAVAGGSFTLSNGVTLTANVLGAVTYSGASPNQAYIVGNVSGALTNNAVGASNNGTGQLNITGNVAGAAINSAHGAFNYSTGTIVVTGNVTGGPAGSSNCYGIGISVSGGRLDVFGTVTGGTGHATNSGIALGNTSSILNVTGTVISGNFTASAIASSGNPTVVITGNVLGSAGGSGSGSNSIGVSAGTAGGVWTINGNVLGDFGNAMLVAAGNNCAVTVNGNVWGSTTVGRSGTGLSHLSTGAGSSLTVNATTIKSTFGIAISCSTPVANITASGGIEGGTAAAITVANTTGTINITGNIVVPAVVGVAGINSSCATPAVVNFVGNATTSTSGGGIGNSVIYHAGTGTVNVTGNLTSSANANSVCGAYNAGIGTINITGNVYASNNVVLSCYGAMNASTGTLNVYGTAFPPTSASATSVGVWNNSTGTCFVQVSQGHNYPNSGILVSGVYGTYQNSILGFITIDAMIFGSGGFPPIIGRHFIRDAGTNYNQMRQSNAGAITTMGEVGSDYPIAANVRNGLSYNFGALTGTLNVPPVGSVALGVPTENTVGTATLSTTALLGADLKTRLENCSTVESVGIQLAAVLT